MVLFFFVVLWPFVVLYMVVKMMILIAQAAIEEVIKITHGGK